MSNLLDPGTAVFIGAGNFVYQGFVVEALDRVVKLEQASIFLGNDCFLSDKEIEIQISKIEFITEDRGELDDVLEQEHGNLSEAEVYTGE